MSAYCCIKLDLFINIESWCTEPWVKKKYIKASCWVVARLIVGIMLWFSGLCCVFGRWLPTFWRNMLPPFSGQTTSSTTVMEALCSTNTAVSTNRTTKHHRVKTWCDIKSKSYVHKYPYLLHRRRLTPVTVQAETTSTRPCQLCSAPMCFTIQKHSFSLACLTL